MHVEKIIGNFWFAFALALFASLPTLLMMSNQGWFGDPRFFNDATAFYCAGQLYADSNANPYSYEQQSSCSAQYGRTYSAFIYLPFVLPLFALWAQAEYSLAMALVISGSLISLAGIYWFMLRYYVMPIMRLGRILWVLPVLLWLALSPVAFMQLPFGQINPIAMGLCVVAIVCLIRQSPAGAGILMALVVALKTPFALLSLAPLLRRNFRFLGAGLLMGLALLLAVVGFRGFEHLSEWVFYSYSQASYAGFLAHGFPGIIERDNVSLFALLYRSFGHEFALLVISFCAISLLGFAAYALYRRRSTELSEYYLYAFALLPVVSYLLSSLTWRAYYIYLFPCIFYLIRCFHLHVGIKRLLALSVALSLIISHEIGFIIPERYQALPTLSVVFAFVVLLWLGIAPSQKSAD